jgi:hypothetical protein
MKENTSAVHHHVNFILRVWGCRPRKWREAPERKHGVEGSALQEADRVLARWTRDTRLSLG